MNTITTTYLEEAQAKHKMLDDGNMTTIELLEAFDWCIANLDQIRKEIAKLTIAELKKRVFSFHAKSKAEWSKAYEETFYRHFLIIELTYQVEIMSLVNKTKEELFQDRIKCIRERIVATTAEDIQKHAESIKEAWQKRKELLKQLIKEVKEDNG
jgi:hypothetical protein